MHLVLSPDMAPVTVTGGVVFSSYPIPQDYSKTRAVLSCVSLSSFLCQIVWIPLNHISELRFAIYGFSWEPTYCVLYLAGSQLSTDRR